MILSPVNFKRAAVVLGISLFFSALTGCGGSPAATTIPPQQDFTISVSPASVITDPDSPTSTFTVSIAGVNGFSGAVTINLTGLPTGATTSPAFPLSLAAGGSQIVTLSIPATALAGNYTLALSATSGSMTHAAQLGLTVNSGQDFSIVPSPATITAVAGSSNASFVVSITGLDGFTASVSLSLAGLPAGTTTSPSFPFNVAAGSSQTVTLSIPATVTPGNYSLILSGTSGSTTHSAPLTLTVTPTMDFSIVLSPTSTTANAGTSNASFAVSITPLNGFAGSVNLSLSGLPAGATTSPAFPFTLAAGSSQTVVLTIPASVTAGNFTLTVGGTSGALTHSAQELLTVLGQLAVTTWHYDNARTSADLWETTLTPANVNSTNFGKLFSKPVDGIVVGHPLYLPSVNLPGLGVHNVVYVATMHDSVFAFDADTADTTPLWMTSVLSYSPAGATTVPAGVKKDAGTTGWSELGIISTPVIDPVTGTLYAVAETYENSNVVHRLHALDVATGLEKFGGPTTITATYTLNGATTTFADLYQMNRPALLLANGHIYIGWGSNCCNDYSQGWVLSYNAATLQQEGAYTAEPGKTLASIWQKGAGISADSSGNIYAETSEGFYAAGTNLSMSILKLSQTGTTLGLADFFTPYNQQYLSDHDLDLNDGVLILPDQPGLYPHELIAEGKEGTIYLLNRDNMGQYCSSCTTGDTQIVQEVPQGAGKQSGVPVYWNNTVYFTGEAMPVTAFTLSNGTLVLPAAAQSITINNGGHAIITANGNTNGVLWTINGGALWAFDAVTLKELYTSKQAANGRDTVPPLAHFATLVAADGEIFIGTQNSLEIYGLLSGAAAIPRKLQLPKVALNPRLPLQTHGGAR